MYVTCAQVMIETRADWAMLKSTEIKGMLNEKIASAKGYADSQFSQDALAMDTVFLRSTYSEKDISMGANTLMEEAMPALESLAEFVMRLKSMKCSASSAATALKRGASTRQLSR